MQPRVSDAERPPGDSPGRLVWGRAGEVLATVAVGLLLYGVLTPLGLLLRTFGRCEVRLPFEPQALSYWIPRVPSGPPPESMSKQY